MAKSAKSFGLRTAALALAVSGMASAALAQSYEIQCYPYIYKAHSPEIANPYKTEDEAHAAAIVVWQTDINTHLGKIWADWGIAKDRALNCVEKDDGYGGYVYLCDVAGYACYKPVELPYHQPKVTPGYTPPKKSY